MPSASGNGGTAARPTDRASVCAIARSCASCCWFEKRQFTYDQLGVYVFVLANGECSAREVQERFDISKPTARKLLEQLVEGGRLENVGSKQFPSYVPSGKKRTHRSSKKRTPILTSLKRTENGGSDSGRSASPALDPRSLAPACPDPQPPAAQEGAKRRYREAAFVATMAVLAGVDGLEEFGQTAPFFCSIYKAEFGEPPQELASQPEEQSSQVPRQQECAPRAPEQVLLANAPTSSSSAAQLPIH